ncbi:MAG: 50S ribosomal protein L11 methyltransferase [Victivallales bacterium]|nr:50S ribosomal protein L11 methyltransferase [Victivallales bacterium]
MQTTPVVVIDSPNEDVPILEEALLSVDLTPSSYSSLETGRAQTFLVAETEDQATDILTKVQSILALWEQLLSEPPQVSLKMMRQEDWANSWKKNFHTFRASERLVVKPSWEEYSPAPGEIVVPIDPGMCFGTGYHGTTMACLQFLDKLQKQHGSLSLIDAGTGSGVLSIGARLLGFSPVIAFDNDPQCIDQALENLAVAGIQDVPVTCDALGEYTPEQPADVAVANILAVILLQNVAGVQCLVKPNGYAILSGILTEQYPEVLQTYTDAGFRELERTTIREWTSGLFQAPPAK